MYIFLDFDGVLNTYPEVFCMRDSNIFNSNLMHNFITLVKVCTLILRLDVHIVITSTRRYRRDIVDVFIGLMVFEFPNLSNISISLQPLDNAETSSDRSDAIYRYISSNNVDKWITIDDLDLFSFHDSIMNENFIKTYPLEGFTKDKMTAALRRVITQHTP